MTDREIRFLVIAGWGISVAIVYSLVLVREYRGFRIHRDNRSRRDVLASFARWLTAAAACFSILAVLLGDRSDDLRGTLTVLALGGFLGAGIVELTDRRPVE